MPRSRSALLGALLLGGAPGVAAQTTPTAVPGQLTLSAEVNVQYAASSVDPYADGFSIRRARLNGAYVVSDLLDAYVQAEFALSGGAEVRDAWVRFSFSPALALSAGQFKRAFDRFELDSFAALSIIGRDGRVGGVDSCVGVGGVCSFSRLNERLGYAGRDQGLRVEGAAGPWSWAATVTNGGGQNVPETNDAKSLSGRVALDVAEGWRVAGQLALHDWADAEAVVRHASAWSADVTWGTFSDGLLFEGALAGGDNWMAERASGEVPAFLALQGMAAWYLPVTGRRFAAVEPLLRLSWADPDTGRPDDAGLLLTPGFMLYVTGKNKIGINLDLWSPSSGDAEYSLKIQSYFHI